jgi:membrane protease YdiL (CAAX protease family)
MAPALVWGWVLNAGIVSQPSEILLGTAVLEGFDSCLTIGLFTWIGFLTVSWPWKWNRIWVWLSFLAALALALLINQAYHKVLTNFLRLHWAGEEAWDISVVTILLVVVQPAIIEELFFRYFALGSLTKITGAHSAVIISGVLFGFAHIYAPLSMPYLVVLGIFLGYSRLASRGLALPMLLHAIHNLVVMLWKGIG